MNSVSLKNEEKVDVERFEWALKGLTLFNAVFNTVFNAVDAC
jgi:hypothetical protein